VNARLLDRISGSGGGTSEYVTPDQDIEAAVGRVASRLTSPALSGLTVSFAGTDVNRTYPRDLPDLFEGGQLIWAGRYRQSGPTTVEIRGKIGNESRSLTVPVELAGPGGSSEFEFVERLWAVRRVGYLIDQVDMNGQNKELTDELVQLSTKYGILTPYTSFLADEGTRLHAFHDNAVRAQAESLSLASESGLSGVSQRAAKQYFQNADRFAANAPATAPADAALGGRTLAAPGLSRMRGSALAAGGAGGGQGAGGYGLPVGGMVVQDAKGETKVVQSVRQIGRKTFFRKGDRWVDSAVTPDLEKKAKNITQFSDDYFTLARNQTAETNQYLTFEEPVTVEIAGQVYKIERPTPRGS
jgi:Ca-activated chloride channel family protein